MSGEQADSAPAIAVTDGVNTGEASIDAAYTRLPLERTLALIKPNLASRSDELAELIEDHGFTIIRVSE